MKHKGDIDLGGNDINNVGSVGAPLGSLNNVTESSPSNGQVLKYNGSAWVNAAEDTESMQTLSDVAFGGPPSSGEVLYHDGSEWTNQALAISDVANLQSTLDAAENIASASGAVGLVGDGARYFSGLDSGATLTAGKLYYLHATTGWEEADASAAATATNLLAMCTSTSTNGTSMLQSGVINAFGSQSTAALGVPMYISETSGEITETAPTTSGAIVRVIGYKVDSTDDTIFFNPSNDWIELS